MKKIVLILMMISISLGILNAQSRIAKVFFVNLYNQKVDVRLGEEDDYVFTMAGLDSFSPTYMLETRDFGEYDLWYRLTGDEEWYIWADKDSNPIMCPVQAGQAHCIIADSDGYMSYYTITEEKGSGARVCFFNGSPSTMARMEVGSEWGEADAFTSNLESYAITNYVSVVSGNYNIYWQLPDQVDNDYYYFYPDESGENAHTFNFKPGNYYLFLAYQKDKGDYSVLYNITP